MGLDGSGHPLLRTPHRRAPSPERVGHRAGPRTSDGAAQSLELIPGMAPARNASTNSRKSSWVRRA
jgi:hypothetical protein